MSELIDEFGFDRTERAACPEAASLWYKIIDARSQRRARQNRHHESSRLICHKVLVSALRQTDTVERPFPDPGP